MITFKNQIPVHELTDRFGGKAIAEFITHSFPILGGKFYIIDESDRQFTNSLNRILKSCTEVGVTTFKGGFIKILKSDKDAQYVGFLHSDDSEDILFASVSKLNEQLNDSLFDALSSVNQL